MESLFPGLPDEIGWECLLRVKLNSHHKLRCVCKSWNAALKSPHFYGEKKRLKFSEQRICMLQKIDGICNRVAVYDLEKNSCKSLPPIPGEINNIFHCHFVKQKLVLIPDLIAGSTRCVLLYDFACLKWRQGAKMPRWLNGFASAADEHGGLIYVGGGFDRFYIDRWNRRYSFGNPVRSALVYNVEEDKWDLLPDMNTYIALIDLLPDMKTIMEFIELSINGVFADGKFYVMGYSGSFEVFDSNARSWKTMENRFDSWCYVCVFGRFYCFSGRGLIEYDYGQDNLDFLGPLPTEDWARSIDFAVVVGNKIFVSKWNTIQGQHFCMVEPPNEIGGTFKLIDTLAASSDLKGSTIHAATLDL
ncbi:hypothetical protein SUGI_0220810 [Cryptomeria japonica]|uniref:F-box/kelch-repeat protein At1g15670-like n=1 Tax=Cryptomeria japonica TaxID=3369 RepID=UPI002408A275|nr:F-box/kelch-repeat protein At1g15670-like [Cryptomeria japonica]GLJ13825.1 hypothetical protein SUGI_0220810 [Cryptomeria japonica]